MENSINFLMSFLTSNLLVPFHVATIIILFKIDRRSVAGWLLLLSTLLQIGSSFYIPTKGPEFPWYIGVAGNLSSLLWVIAIVLVAKNYAQLVWQNKHGSDVIV